MANFLGTNAHYYFSNGFDLPIINIKILLILEECLEFIFLLQPMSSVNVEASK